MFLVLIRHEVVGRRGGRNVEGEWESGTGRRGGGGCNGYVE